MPLKTEIKKTDEELIAGLKQQNQTAYEELFDKFSPLTLTLLTELNLNEQKTEEVLLACFVNIFNNIENFDATKQRLFTWVLIEIRATINNMCALEKKTLQIRDIKNYVQENGDLSNPAFIRLLILHGGNAEELAVLVGMPKQELACLIKNNINQLKK
jgi:DNA-directed RNA polymerase specialized sigma24 family protein